MQKLGLIGLLLGYPVHLALGPVWARVGGAGTGPSLGPVPGRDIRPNYGACGSLWMIDRI